MPSRRSIWSLLVLCTLLGACDKKVLRENVKLPPAQGGPSTPGPSLDGGVIVDEPDAEVGAPEGGASEVVDDGPTEFSKANLLEAAGKCALASFRVFAERAEALEQATQRWADDSTDANAAAARAAFRAAMDSFQRAELFRFGPAAPATEPGGKGLRDQIYAFPHQSACKVDEQLVNQAYASADFGSTTPIGRGLAALEYLDYYVGADNACAASLAINADGSWQKLSESELRTRRSAYAAAVASDIARYAKLLLRAFAPAPEGDDFVNELATAGRGSKAYSTEQAALNALSHALYYVEIEVKDYKLALPLGISPNCTTGSTCPNAVESPYARVSTGNIAANLRGFRALFQGCGTDHAGLGFDDWLEAVGQGALAASMLKALDGAEAAVRDLSPPIERAIVEDPTRVREVYDALKALTDQLKQQFISVLDLNPPMSAEGDND
ncbi:MAG TPA: imelysin family protein [Polyangiales bacterium]